MTTLTLSLGPLVLVATQDGPLLRVSVSTPTTADAGTLCLTIPEWSSLAAVADVLAAGERRHAEDRKEIDARITWQVQAVAHMQAWRGLFDAAVAMDEHAEGCADEPPCGDCTRCRFHAAVDEAMKATAANSHGFIDASDLSAEIDVLKQECRELTEQRDAACSALALRERMEGGHG